MTRDRRATPPTVEKNMRLVDPQWKVHWQWEIRVTTKQIMRSRMREIMRRKQWEGVWFQERLSPRYTNLGAE